MDISFLVNADFGPAPSSHCSAERYGCWDIPQELMEVQKAGFTQRGPTSGGQRLNPPNRRPFSCSQGTSSRNRSHCPWGPLPLSWAPGSGVGTPMGMAGLRPHVPPPRPRPSLSSGVTRGLGSSDSGDGRDTGSVAGAGPGPEIGARVIPWVDGARPLMDSG